MTTAEILHIERIGGFGGFGLPGSHLKSKGDISTSALSTADRQALQLLFRDAGAHAGAAMPDEFIYRITRQVGTQQQTIEVPESKVPLPIRNCVKDTLE